MSDYLDTDDDGDGVYDGPDLCPDTPKGSRVDRDGCPPPALVLPDINFELDSAELRPRAKGILDSVASVLSQRPEVRIEIGGHASDRVLRPVVDEFTVELTSAGTTRLVGHVRDHRPGHPGAGRKAAEHLRRYAPAIRCSPVCPASGAPH